MSPTTSDTDLRRRVAELGWYHTIELPGGVETPGHFDTRPTVAKVPLPASLDGKRCLDVGTWDGFWAFEMERRGGDVTAIDVLDPARWDWPPHDRLGEALGQRAVLESVKGAGEAFTLARDALGSRVERLDLSVYDLSPERVGRFDFVFLGSLLLHLRDPVAALDALRSVCSGQAVITDSIELIPTLLRPHTAVARFEGLDKPWWWQPNAAGLVRMIESAGWVIEERTPLYFLPTGDPHPRLPWRALPRQLLSAAGREKLIVRFRGVPHVAVRARPVA